MAVRNVRKRKPWEKHLKKKKPETGGAKGKHREGRRDVEKRSDN